jgi:hypothetical protein
MRAAHACLGTLVVSVLLAAPLLAQTKSTATPGGQGKFWIGVGAGGASARVSCDACKDPRRTGFSGYARLGTRAGRHLLLGAEGNGWYKRENGIRFQLYALDAVAFLYAGPKRGLYLKAGAGAMFYVAKDTVDKFTATVPHVQIGLGYDLPLGPSFWLTPYANFQATWKGQLKFNGADVQGGSNTHISVIQIGIGMTWH